VNQHSVELRPHRGNSGCFLSCGGRQVGVEHFVKVTGDGKALPPGWRALTEGSLIVAFCGSHLMKPFFEPVNRHSTVV
jgi:hypothetical protein